MKVTEFKMTFCFSVTSPDNYLRQKFISPSIEMGRNTTIVKDYVGEMKGSVVKMPFYVENKKVGHIIIDPVNGDLYFYKTVQRYNDDEGKGHFMFKWNAWAVQSFIVPQLKRHHVKGLVLDVKGEGLIFISLDKFLLKSWQDEFGNHGLQHFVIEDHWADFKWPEHTNLRVTRDWYNASSA